MAKRIGITVPAASVGADLTDFPVYVDLSGMPSGFWGNLAYPSGADIRVKDGGGSDVPFDLVHFDSAGQAGALFFKSSLSSSTPTTVYLHYGDPAVNALVAAGAANGRNAVWADYHAVVIGGADLVNRTGGTPVAAAVGSVELWATASTSADLGVHQGVAWDGTHYYVTDDNAIKKYNSSFVLQATNSNPNGNVGTGNHCGDPCVVGSVLYVPHETYPAVANQKIARFNTSDLSYIGSWTVSAQGHECSSIAYNATDGYLYVSSFNDGSKLWRYNASTGAYVGQTTMGTTIGGIQGITFFNGKLYVNSDDDNCTYEFTINTGANTTSLVRVVFGLGGGNYEGIDSDATGLLILHDTTGSANGKVVKATDTRRGLCGGGIGFGSVVSTSGRVEVSGVTRYTTWTMGLTVNLSNKSANRALASYTQLGQTSDAHRATLAYRQSTDRLGLWNDTDTWLTTTSSPATGTVYRVAATHAGTTERKLYVNGTAFTDTTVVARPSATGNGVYIGIEDASFAESMRGEVGFFYLRAAALSAAWLAAESLNVLTPGGFYTLGSVEETSAQTMTVATVVGAAGQFTSDNPVEYVTVVGSVGTGAVAVPIDLVTAVVMEAASGGTVAGGGGTGVPGGPLTLSFATVVGSAQAGVASEPEAVLYQNLTGSVGAYSGESPVAYATVVGARAAAAAFVNGRRDLLDQNLYRR